MDLLYFFNFAPWFCTWNAIFLCKRPSMSVSQLYTCSSTLASTMKHMCARSSVELFSETHLKYLHNLSGEELQESILTIWIDCVNFSVFYCMSNSWLIEDDSFGYFLNFIYRLECVKSGKLCFYVLNKTSTKSNVYYKLDGSWKMNDFRVKWMGLVVIIVEVFKYL